ncbi:MAG: tetratricopeptide repeat protein [Thermoanaerobaculales bacterium]
MHRNPWFTLVLGLMVGLVFGYVFAERQPVPPGKALMLGVRSAGAQDEALPEGHPPVEAPNAAEAQRLGQKTAEIEGLLASNPNDAGLMAAMANVYFDVGRWNDARVWYEKSLAVTPDDANVITDLAISYRNLKRPERAIELLDHALEIEPDHWQAWYNKVIVFHFDLHEHEQAAVALRKLQELRTVNSSIPDLSGLEKEILAE